MMGGCNECRSESECEVDKPLRDDRLQSLVAGERGLQASALTPLGDSISVTVDVTVPVAFEMLLTERSMMTVYRNQAANPSNKVKGLLALRPLELDKGQAPLGLES